MRMRVIQRDDQLTHVEFDGDLDIAGTQQIDVEFHGAVASRRRPTIVDMSKVANVGSLGMGMLAACAGSLGRHGAKLVLLNPQPMVEQLFHVIALDSVMPIAHSLDEAKKLLKATGAAGQSSSG